jgi:DNA adenine methylase
MNETTVNNGRLVPPLKMHGGKFYMAPKVINLMPPHMHYTEAFFGSGQVLFARDPQDPRLWWTGKTSDGRKANGVSEVINDLNSDLMNFYRVLKDPELFGRFRDRLELTLHSEDEWNASRELLAGTSGDAVVRAAALFTFCRQSLSGRMQSFAPTVRTRLRGGRNDGVNAWWTAVNGLEAVHHRLKGVKVLNRPALEVIRSEDTPAALHYLDPPYVHGSRSATEVYRYEMTDDDHRQLLDLLLTLKGKVMLSGYPNDLYDTGLPGWNRHTFNLPNNASGGKSKRRITEAIWCNF